MDTFWDAASCGRTVYRARSTILSPSARFTELSDDDSVVAKFATTTVDGELEQESNLQILKKCSSGRQKSYANKKTTRLSGLALTMVETRGIEPLTS